MARTTTEHTIVNRSADQHGVVHLEAIGTGAIYPGKLLEMESNEYVQHHSVASGATAKLVALESQTPDTHDYPTTAAIDIPYASGDTVYYTQASPGDVLNMWLAAGQDVSKGIDWLISDGAGALTSCGTGVSVGTSNPVGLAWEDAVPGESAGRCLVRII